MKYKGVIFDLDGVICSTDEYHYRAWKALADRLGIPFSREDNARQRGVSRMESLEIVLEKSDRPYSEEEKKELAEYKNRLYVEMLQEMSENDLSKEVKSTLDALKRGGIKIAIGSSSKNTPLILERLGLRGYFDAVSDGNHITHSKPHPEVFLLAAQFLALQPQQCLVVEDAVSGIDAGITGGFDTAAIGYATVYEKATYRLQKFEDILSIINE